jgi:nucleotide-binding universal stress UspA family protein
MYDRILFSTDGSDGATAVSDRVFDLAETHDATVHVLNVADTTHESVVRVGGQVVDALEQGGERIVRETAARANERNVDLVVMGTHGRTGFDRYVLGSVTEKTVRSAGVPVLTVPPSGDD